MFVSGTPVGMSGLFLRVDGLGDRAVRSFGRSPVVVDAVVSVSEPWDTSLDKVIDTPGFVSTRLRIPSALDSPATSPSSTVLAVAAADPLGFFDDFVPAFPPAVFVDFLGPWVSSAGGADGTVVVALAHALFGRGTARHVSTEPSGLISRGDASRPGDTVSACRRVSMRWAAGAGPGDVERARASRGLRDRGSREPERRHDAQTKGLRVTHVCWPLSNSIAKNTAATRAELASEKQDEVGLAATWT